MAAHHSPDQCTTCTTCTAYCPVSEVTRKFRGPKMTGPAFERFRLLNKGEEESLAYCSNCKNCDISCPFGVPVSTFNMMARGEYCKTHKPGLGNWFVSHGEFIAKWIGFIPAFLRNFGMNNPVTRLILHLIGIHKNAPLPNFAHKTFWQRFKAMPKPNENSEKMVVLYPGCYVNVYSPQMGTDLVEVLHMAGYKVIVPKGFVCCGVPLVSNGYADEAEKYAVKNTEELAKWTIKGVPVIAACPSCGLMLKQDYKDLFPSVKLAGENAGNVVDACEFVIGLIKSGELKAEYKQDYTDVLYHAPCHLRAQGIGRTGLELAEMIPCVSVKDADSGCCGISGSYGFKKDNYQIGMDVGSRLFDAVAENPTAEVITECGTCQVQIKHGTKRTAIHPVSLLRKRIIN